MLIVVPNHFAVVTIEESSQFWFAIVTKRFVEAAKSFALKRRNQAPIPITLV